MYWPKKRKLCRTFSAENVLNAFLVVGAGHSNPTYLAARGTVRQFETFRKMRNYLVWSVLEVSTQSLFASYETALLLAKVCTASRKWEVISSAHSILLSVLLDRHHLVFYVVFFRVSLISFCVEAVWFLVFPFSLILWLNRIEFYLNGWTLTDQNSQQSTEFEWNFIEQPRITICKTFSALYAAFERILPMYVARTAEL